MRSERRWALALAVVAATAGLSGSSGSASVTRTTVLVVTADATVAEDAPKKNFGTDGELASDSSPDLESYLRFDVPPLGGPVRRATLRLYVTDSNRNAPIAHATSPQWDELSLTWSNRPAARKALGESDRLHTGEWAEYSVTSAVVGAGPVAFVLVPDSADGAKFSSGEGRPQHRPQLVIETRESSTTSTTTTTTSTTTTTRPKPTTTTTRPKPTTTTTKPATTTTRPATTTTRPQPVPGTCRSDFRTAQDVGDFPAGATEVSGLVASKAHPGWGWMIRDSGNPASLYSVRLEGAGARVNQFPVPGAVNRDWEDVAYTTGANGRGVLWILDNMGNEWRGKRAIYKVEEPDPRGGGSATLLGRYEISYPDNQWNTETLFAFDGDLVLIAKGAPRMYRFTAPLASGKVNVPAFIGALPDVSAPTLGAVSPDRRFLVVANYTSVWIFENRGALSDLRSLIAHPAVMRQKLAPDSREGGAFFPAGSCDFVMAAESGNIWKLSHGA